MTEKVEKTPRNNGRLTNKEKRSDPTLTNLQVSINEGQKIELRIK